MKNDNAAVDSGVSIIMMTLIASLMITSSLVSFFVFSVYGFSPAAIGTVDLNFNGFQNSQDFTNNCNLLTYTASLPSGSSISGNWACDSSGLTLTGQGFILVAIDQSKVPSNGIFQNNYHILNPNGGDYYVVISQSTIAGQSEDLYVKNDGFYIISHTTILGVINNDYTVAYVPFSGANQIQDVTIQTSLDANAPSLSFTFNGNTYNVASMGNIDTTNIQASTGIQGYNGLTLVTMGDTVSKSSSSGLDGLSMISGFIGNIIMLIIWNISPSIFPWVLNMLLIKTQCIGIFICLMVIVRG